MIGAFLHALLSVCQLFPPPFPCRLNDQHRVLLVPSPDISGISVSICLNCVTLVQTITIYHQNFCQIGFPFTGLTSFQPFLCRQRDLIPMSHGKFLPSPAWYRSCFSPSLRGHCFLPCPSPTSFHLLFPGLSTSLKMLCSLEVSVIPESRNTLLPLLSNSILHTIPIHPWGFILGGSRLLLTFHVWIGDPLICSQTAHFPC